MTELGHISIKFKVVRGQEIFLHFTAFEICWRSVMYSARYRVSMMRLLCLWKILKTHTWMVLFFVNEELVFIDGFSHRGNDCLIFQLDVNIQFCKDSPRTPTCTLKDKLICSFAPGRIISKNTTSIFIIILI